MPQPGDYREQPGPGRGPEYTRAAGFGPQGQDPGRQPPAAHPQWGGQQPDPWAGSVAGGQPQYPPQPSYQPPPQYQQPQYQPPGYGSQFPPPGPPRRHKKSRGYATWIAAGVVIGVAAAGAAVYVLHGSNSGPLTCAQQYANWKTGPANAPGKQLEAAAAGISAAGKSEDIAVMDSGLKALGADATTLQAYPMPACADPAGYWSQYLGAMKAAGDNAGTASGLGGLLLAEAPLKQVPAIQSKLTAELAQTAGVPAS